MKRYTTRTLKSVAFFYLAFPLFYLVAAATLFDMPGKSCMSVLLSPWYWAVSALAIISGYGLWEMRRWAWYLFAFANFLILYLSAIVVTDYGESHHKVLAFALAAVAILASLYRVSREVRVPYFFPKIRWWESNPRYKLSVPVKVETRSGEPVSGEILDLSMVGCFVKLRTEVAPDAAVALVFTAFGQPLRCEGVVVWQTQSTVTHPRGIGVKFAPMERAQKRPLRLVAQKLRRISALYRSSRYLLNQEDFLKKLEEIERGDSKLRA